MCNWQMNELNQGALHATSVVSETAILIKMRGIVQFHSGMFQLSPATNATNPRPWKSTFHLAGAYLGLETARRQTAH